MYLKSVLAVLEWQTVPRSHTEYQKELLLPKVRKYIRMQCWACQETNSLICLLSRLVCYVCNKPLCSFNEVFVLGLYAVSR